jgi:hypothetical protein
VTEETMSVPVSVPVEYSPWTIDPASGMLVSIVRRADTGEIIGKAERMPDETTE